MATRAYLNTVLYVGKMRPTRFSPGYEAWNQAHPNIEPFTLQIDSKTAIDGRYLKPDNWTGKVILISLGNGMLYEDYTPQEFQQYTSIGTAVCLYNPPQYGRSKGVRTPSSDFRAIEGVIDHLLEKKGVQVGDIELIGLSLGSGPVCHAATKYSVGKLTLHVPIGRMEEVVERIISNVVSWPIGRRIAAWLTTPIVCAHFNYDNVACLEKSQAAELVIYDRRDDSMMFVGGTPEGEKLFNAFPQDRGPQRVIMNGSHQIGLMRAFKQ